MRPFEVGAGYACATEIGSRQASMLQIGPDQICLSQIGAREIGTPQKRMVELHSPENRIRKVVPGKIGRGEIAALPLPPVGIEISAVHRQDLYELLARYPAQPCRLRGFAIGGLGRVRRVDLCHGLSAQIEESIRIASAKMGLNRPEATRRYPCQRCAVS